MFRNLKIRTHFQVAIGLIVLLIVSSSGFVIYNSLKNSLYKDYLKNEYPLIILRSAQSNLQVVLSKAMETSELLASDPTLVSWFSSGDTVTYKHLALQKIDDIHKSYNYETVFAVNRSTKKYWCENHQLREIVSEYDSNDVWYFNAISGNKSTILDFDYNKELKKMYLFVDVLMYSQDSVIGIAGVGLYPKLLIDEINKFKLSSSSDIWLIDKKGDVIIASDADDISFSLSKFIAPSTLNHVLSDNDNAILSSRLDDETYEIAYLRIADTEYKLVMQTPQKDLFPVLTILERQAFWFSIVLLLSMLVLVSVLASMITRPILRLEQLTIKFAKGEYGEEVDENLIRRKDEIGSLAVSFNDMRKQLSEYIETVKQTNIALGNEKEQLKRANDKLSVTLRKASESERLTQSFLANISHEIRTPMNSILGFSQLLEFADVESGEYKKYASNIIKGAQQLLDILDSIINLSKIESGVVEPVIKQESVNKMLSETYTLYGELARRKGLSMYLEINENDDVKMMTDVALFQLVLNNLVSNSIKYTEKGEIRLGYKRNGEAIKIYISDSGIGIDKSKLKTIFKPFIQIQDKELKPNKGAGLGLAIVSKVLAILGGAVEVQSETGKGSVFYVIMPLK